MATVSEGTFEELVRRARASGVEVELHHRRGCAVLLVPSRRQISIWIGAALEHRFRLLCEALRQLKLGALVASLPAESTVAPPAPGSQDAPTLQVYLAPLAQLTPDLLGDSMVAPDCEDTLRDDTSSVSRAELERHLARTRETDDARGCELCGARSYARIGDLVLCRSHLYATVESRLLPHEVLALRTHHPNHPELGRSRYDANGDPL